jgi:hypothetical protein
MAAEPNEFACWLLAPTPALKKIIQSNVQALAGGADELIGQVSVLSAYFCVNQATDKKISKMESVGRLITCLLSCAGDRVGHWPEYSVMSHVRTQTVRLPSLLESFAASGD